MLFAHIDLSSQALRYSYFHVGQALGTPQQILEQGRPQPGLVPLQAPLQTQQTLQQQPLLLKPVPPSQPPPPNQHCSPPRPLQQIQPSPVSAAAQVAVYQRHTELMREQQPKHILKQEQTEGTPQSHLPYIVDKSLQSKVRLGLAWKHDACVCVCVFTIYLLDISMTIISYPEISHMPYLFLPGSGLMSEAFTYCINVNVRGVTVL